MSKSQITALLCKEFITLSARKRKIEKRLDEIKDIVKAELPEGGKVLDPSKKYIAEVRITEGERLAGKEVLFRVVTEERARAEGLVVPSTSRTVSVDSVEKAA